MNVELIRIDPAIAKAKLHAYRKALAARAHTEAGRAVRAEYEQIEQAYKVAAKGLPLIELSKAMAMGGWDEQGRPRFAISAADRSMVRCNTDGNGLVFKDPDASEYRRSRLVLRVAATAMPPRPTGKDTWSGWNLRAIVPMVPPDVLPRPDLDLSRRVILWEADWTAAPVDPLLLLPIGGDLYAVEAAWDLTALERAVIAGRAQ